MAPKEKRVYLMYPSALKSATEISWQYFNAYLNAAENQIINDKNACMWHVIRYFYLFIMGVVNQSYSLILIVSRAFSLRSNDQFVIEYIHCVRRKCNAMRNP